MLASLLLSALAGFLTPQAEPYVAKAFARLGKGEWRPLEARELRVLSFGLMLLLAATAGPFLDADSSAWLAAAGGLLGYFGRDLYAFARDPDGAKGDPGDDWDGEVTEPGKHASMEDLLAEGSAPPGGGGTREDDADETLRAVKEAVWPGSATETETQPAPDAEPDQTPDPKEDAK
ncbi:hypothetical protein [Tropicimonas marinistellae]|uniref:hypothetical protein n=1 Tax=Tropicimonas marinistellae TaxID=1739787 RepID=UPI000835A104|nr:hypothetical protein [Tropicimonas marinistellae]